MKCLLVNLMDIRQRCFIYLFELMFEGFFILKWKCSDTFITDLITNHGGGGGDSVDDILDTITIIVKVNTFTFIIFIFLMHHISKDITTNLTTSEHTLRIVWRYYRGNQKPLMEICHTIQISPKFNKIRVVYSYNCMGIHWQY